LEEVNVLRRLREEAKKFDCSVCGTNHARSDIRVLGKLDSAWIVRVTCSSCSTAFKLLVVVQEQEAAVTPVKEETPRAVRRRPVVTSDDVLDAHEALRNVHNVTALFERKSGAQARSRRTSS
jgi:hypothetical protein